jgi:hypothetical protein
MGLNMMLTRHGLQTTARGFLILLTLVALTVTTGFAGGCVGGFAPPGEDNDNHSVDPTPGGDNDGHWWRPAVQTTWHWQLQPDGSGQINVTYGVDAYDLDLFDVPASLINELHEAGRRVICYFSAGTYEDFRDDADEFNDAEIGNVLEDFADERWLDVRSSNVRRIMQDRLDLAIQKGCDAVEPDNVTGFVNDTGFDLTADVQLAYNRFLAEQAHARGLAIALKNDLEQIAELVKDFDFSVNEQCHEFDECDALFPFIEAGKPVFNAEYAAEFVENESARRNMCAEATARGLRTLVLPVDLDDSFRFSCDP